MYELRKDKHFRRATHCPACGSVLPSPGSSSASNFSRAILVDNRGRQYIISPQSNTLIGSRGCSILLTGAGVPAQAARLTPNANGFILEDLSGSVKVNGTPLKGQVGLQSGDKINIGTANLIYRGPSTIALIPLSSKLPYSIASPALVGSTSLGPPPVAVKNWGTAAPLIEGTIEFMDGPHQVERGNMGGKVAASLILGLISEAFMMLPFWMKQDISVWYLRVKTYPGGRVYAVVMRGEPGSLPQISDFIAIWGVEKDGNILMKQGYNYTTNSFIVLKG